MKNRARKTEYTTFGADRGCCGHIHASVAEAKQCIDAHDEQLRQEYGGYSDRRVASIAEGDKLIDICGVAMRGDDHGQLDDIARLPTWVRRKKNSREKE